MSRPHTHKYTHKTYINAHIHTCTHTHIHTHMDTDSWAKSTRHVQALSYYSPGSASVLKS